MEACEYWWVLLEKNDGCNYLIHQHHNTPDDNASILAALIHHLITRLPLTEAQVMKLLLLNHLILLYCTNLYFFFDTVD